MTSTAPLRLLAIPGDGIGPEVVSAALEVLAAVVPNVQVETAAAGWAVFQQTGTALPPATLELARAADAVLFGAVASPSTPVPGYRSPIVALRHELDLFANIRPVDGRPWTIDRGQPASSAASPVHRPSSASPVHRPSSVVDLVVVRENTEGLYSGRERMEGNDTAIAERVITRRGSNRIVRAAFELARARAADRPGHRPTVTIVHKANVLRVTDGLFREEALAVAAEFPDVAANELLVDTAAMHLARDPGRFDVIVTTNMFGDILSDVACIHGGGLGLASSANIGLERALFEPVHGAAPDIVGRGIANPLGAIGCIAMLLEWLAPRQANGDQLRSAARRIRTAIAQIIIAGPHTPDLGGTATTAQITQQIVTALTP
jgi:homoisocitrate dehydrogenase